MEGDRQMAITIEQAPKIYESDLREHHQGYDVTKLGRIGDHKVRYRLHVDTSYWRQSRGAVQVFSPRDLEWKTLWAAHATDLKGAPRNHDAGAEHVTRVVQGLHEKAVEILTD